jgi:hypothetical protein
VNVAEERGGWRHKEAKERRVNGEKRKKVVRTRQQERKIETRAHFAKG